MITLEFEWIEGVAHSRSTHFGGCLVSYDSSDPNKVECRGYQRVSVASFISSGGQILDPTKLPVPSRGPAPRATGSYFIRERASTVLEDGELGDLESCLDSTIRP